MSVAFKDLAERYRDAWRTAWRKRRSMDGPVREADELAFLPAALSLQETPVHPLPRYLQWSLLMFIGLALAWACIGEIDVIASAEGKIVPSGRSKLIQASEVAVVQSIHVVDGQPVRKGDVLVELEGQLTEADIKRLGSELLAAQIDQARASTLLSALDGDVAPASLAPLIPQATAAQQAGAQRWLEGQYLELQATLEQADAEIGQRAAEIRSAQGRADALRQLLVITRQLTADYKLLFSESAVAKHTYLEKEQARLEQERELALQRSRIDELNAARLAAQHRRSGAIAQLRRAMLDLHGEAQRRIATLEQELNKAEQRHRLKVLTSPVDGTVQQLAIHTQGGVVTPAQTLMVIVPTGEPVEVEVKVENKDIGFVFPGQHVEVKIETFTFTRYGVVPGVVESISDDAIEDDRHGLLYSARIKLAKEALRVGDNDLPLTAGMAVRAEVIVDRRRVISFFLSPLQRHAKESLKER
ncbi:MULTISPECIES: HlyD family type I secretion periplasmic adaptor subunit [Pseudomonas]|uniref:HlyD family type I secretion periplasmic adaptor subunit n=1 Tax=Pseudomonas TaxID=286 RepID=UPI00159EA963|nr:HlyD family type I secretion periplasmic adaptor subunit [Pseudomonas putida]NVN62965.1 HlyD family type I secretion periplasmic adaptor subunit [Pseudomonas putida]NVN67958.1 HlyD family type I secretion periplasmic adaptor subunit [Pseudomonas putida]